MAEGAIGVSPQMSTRVWPPPWPSWIEALAPPRWMCVDEPGEPGQEAVVVDAELAAAVAAGALG